MKKRISILLFILMILFGACIKDITETIEKASHINTVRWNPSIAIPLTHANLSFRDFIGGTNASQYIQIKDDSLITLVYEDKYISDKVEDILNLDAQNYGETFTFTSEQLNALNTLGQVKVIINRTISYDGDGNELDQIWFKQGQINLGIESTFEHDIACILNIPDSKKGGTPISLNLDANYLGTPIDASSIYELANAEIDFTKTAQGHSELTLEFEFTITKIPTNTIKSSESITYAMAIENQKFSKITGYFDQLKFDNVSGQFSVPFFENSTNGSIGIVEPTIHFYSSSSLGIPLDITMKQFDGKNNSNTIVPLSSNSGSIVIQVPKIDTIGAVADDSLVLNNTNSNLVNYISNRPINNSYSVSIQPNPSNNRHWLLDTSRLSSNIKLTLPLFGTLKDYLLEKTSSFELSLKNAEEIKEVLVRLYTENGFPVDVNAQLYFEDSNTNIVIDSLLITGETIFESAPVDINGKPIAKSSKTTDIILDANRVDRVRSANQVRIKAILSTFTGNSGNQPNIRIYSFDQIAFQLGVQAEVLINQEL